MHFARILPFGQDFEAYKQKQEPLIATVHMDFSKVEIPKDFFETYFHQELANGKKV